MASELIGSLYPTKIPGYADSADIQAAFKLYHYGSLSYDTANTDPTQLVATSVAYALNDLQDQVDAIIPGLSPSLFTAKGDLLSATASSTPTKLSVGVNGQVLTVNSAASTGLEWSTPEVTLINSVTLTNKTLTSPTINTPTLTLSTSSSTTDARVAWDTTNKKIQVGNGTSAIDFASSTLSISVPTFTTNAYTAGLTDKDKWLELTNGATAATFYINTDAAVAFPIGTQINIIQTGTGQITIAPTTSGTTTINGTPGLKLRTQWSSATIIKRAANLWVVVGDLSA